MQKHKLDPSVVAGCYHRSRGVELLSHMSIRAAHVLDIWYARRPDLKLINLSQSVDRAGGRDKAVMHCVTPNGAFWCVDANRLLLSVEKMIMMGLPIHMMDLGVNTACELHSLAGNAMHTKALTA